MDIFYLNICHFKTIHNTDFLRFALFRFILFIFNAGYSVILFPFHLIKANIGYLLLNKMSMVEKYSHNTYMHSILMRTFLFIF